MAAAPRSTPMARPVRTAAPSPRLAPWAWTVAPAARAAVAVPSVEPSSTTTTSTGWPATSAGVRRTTAPTVGSSLWAGKTTTIGRDM